ncbi:MAG TPA: Gfo/Idh/MocA family oxidoreductase [Pirellulales bacterium]
MTKTFRVGVIGSTGHGNYGHGLDEVWLHVPQAEIVAVADDDKPGAAAAAKRLQAPRTYFDYRKMLDEAKPQIVSICPRWLNRHHELVLACAERGIHVYLEKPLARTLAEADEMVAACERAHVKLAVAHQTRYSPKLPVVKELLASGKIGRVLEFRGRGKEDARGGGEDLWVLGTHIMDLIRYLGGQPASCFGVVTTAGHPIGRADVVEGAEGIGPLAGDSVRAMYALPGGSAAYFASQRNAAGRPSRFGLQIYGSAGVIEVLTGYLPSVKYLADGGWSPGRSRGVWQDVSSAGIGKSEPLPDGSQLAGNTAAIEDLLAAIEADRQPQSSIYEARAAMEMIVAVFESQRQAAPVRLPLESRENPLTKLT